jgi:hypothetical protein
MLNPLLSSEDRGVLILLHGVEQDVDEFSQALVLAKMTLLSVISRDSVLFSSKSGPVGVMASLDVKRYEHLVEVVGRFSSYKDIPEPGSAAVVPQDRCVDAAVAGGTHFLRKLYTASQLVNFLRLAPDGIGQAEMRTGSRWVLDMAARALMSPAFERISLTEGEWDFVSALKKRSPGKVDRRDLIEMMGHNISFYGRNRMDALVRRLRLKIGASTAADSPIQTVHGLGYVWRE